jgi:23S rRNA pseudouridine2604 synthase
LKEKKLKRINKLLSEYGYSSRRGADKLIEEGRVTINGKVPEKGTKVSNEDLVYVDGDLIKRALKDHIYIAFNKPRGIVCTTDINNEKDNIIDFIGYPKRIFPIGRLDKASEGLIFLTSDGNIVNKILRARNNHEKEYEVRVNKPITNEFIRRMSEGIPIMQTTTNKCKVVQINKFYFKITLTQGLNRQIRKMCNYLSYEVYKLKRIRIMNINLDIPYGEWRYITENEMIEINKLVKESHMTFDQED